MVPRTQDIVICRLAEIMRNRIDRKNTLQVGEFSKDLDQMCATDVVSDCEPKRA
jgi:hypothetical protein